MTKIKVKCIDEEDKPSIIPDNLWVKKDGYYHITHIYKMVEQNNIQGCALSELDISAYIPYNCFKLSRFAFKPEDIPSLIEMMKDCTALNDITINELIKELNLETV